MHDIIPTLPAEAYPPPFTSKGLYYRHVNNNFPVSFQLNSIARNHYIGCYLNKISRSDPEFTSALCLDNTDFCPSIKICTPYNGNC